MEGRTRRLALAAALAMAALMAGACGGTSTEQSGKLRVAMLLPGNVADEGFNADGKRTSELVKKELGADVALSTSVPLPNQADVYRQYASQGYDLVIGWGGQFSQGAETVSKEFPKVKFLVVNGQKGNGTNLAATYQWSQTWEFVGGYALAKLSKSGVIGAIGGQCFPGTALTLNSVAEGAKYAKPTTKVIITYTGDFEDPTKAQAAAQAMLEQGADGFIGNLNNGFLGVLKAAETKPGTVAFTDWADNHQLAPKIIASSVLRSQAAFVLNIVKDLQKGAFEAKLYEMKMTKDSGPALSKTDLLPDTIYKEAIDIQSKIVSGQITPAINEACPR